MTVAGIAVYVCQRSLAVAGIVVYACQRSLTVAGIIVYVWLSSLPATVAGSSVYDCARLLRSDSDWKAHI